MRFSKFVSLNGSIKKRVGSASLRWPKAHDNAPKLLNKQETADILRISIHTLNQWISQGKIVPTKLGTRVLFDLDYLVSWLDTKRVKPD